MNILFYGTKPYDKKFFSSLAQKEEYKDIAITFIEERLTKMTALLAKGKDYSAVCAFVNMDVGKETIDILHDAGVKLILMRCAGFNNVEVEYAKEKGLVIMRVPSYSPEAVAEHAMALALCATRKIHKAYIKCRENNYDLQGLMGVNLHGKTAGIVGMGKIGQAMANICHGFGMRVLGVDKFPSDNLPFVEYVSFEKMLSLSDLISLHCPLTNENFHLIDKVAISKMKDHVILVNTSRGELVSTDDLIEGIIQKKFFAVGLDVFEGEKGTVYEDFSDKIIKHNSTARLLSFPNVVITSHQAFFTKEAMEAISKTTLDNALAFLKGEKNGNEV